MDTLSLWGRLGRSKTRHAKREGLNSLSLESLSLLKHAPRGGLETLLLCCRLRDRLFDGSLLRLERGAYIFAARGDQEVSHRETLGALGVDRLDPKPLSVVLNSLLQHPDNHTRVNLS